LVVDVGPWLVAEELTKEQVSGEGLVKFLAYCGYPLIDSKLGVIQTGGGRVDRKVAEAVARIVKREGRVSIVALARQPGLGSVTVANVQKLVPEVKVSEGWVTWSGLP
jgi:hypothetical protein